MRILVAGASGLIGQRLGIELVRRGHELVVFSRQQEALGIERAKLHAEQRQARALENQRILVIK